MSVETWPKVGDLLTSEDGDSLIVPDGTDKAKALVMLVAEVYGGDDLDPSNPVLVAALPYVTCGVWRRYSPAMVEAEGIDPDEYLNWYGPHGDGETIGTVVDYEGSVYALGDEAWEWAEEHKLDGSGR